MISLWQLLLPAELLVHCLNAGLTSLVACGIAVALSRRAAWSLPVHHALLTASLTVSLAAPVFVPMLHAPSLWTIQVSTTVDAPSPAVITPPNETIPRDEPVPPPIATAIPVASAEYDRPTAVERTTVVPVTPVPNSTANATIDDRQTLSPISWARFVGTLFCGIWFAGIAVGLARAMIGLARLSHWMQTVTADDSLALAAAARSAADSLGLRSPVSLYHSSLVPAPVTLGLLRPRIVVPLGIESSLAPVQLHAVIRHELAHIARRDLWIGLLQHVAAIVYWWNPLVHWSNRQLADLREQICDDIAICGLPEPSTYAATLISFADRCSLSAQVPATLGIGSSPAGQLENRIRRIVSPSETRCIHLTRPATIGISAAVILMTVTILLAQVQVQSPVTDKKTKPVHPESPAYKPESPPATLPLKSTAAQDPTLHDLIQQMAVYERMYLPYDIKAMETFRFPDDLTPQERARNLRADGRKHQRLMEYAQVERRIWRKKETELIDDEETQSYEQYSDGERIIQVSPSPAVINGNKTREYHINNRKNDIFNYQHSTPLIGIFCLSSYGGSELFSEVFKADEEAVELAWDNGDAKLAFGYGHPKMKARLVLWLSRAHAWHPIRLQRYWSPDDKLFFDEWEVTKFVRHEEVWRVAEGTHRYRDLREMKLPDPKIKYSLDFKVLGEEYGSKVNENQFRFEIPAGSKIREDQKPEAEPPPPTKTRAITVTVIDVAGKPIPNASVRLPVNRVRDFDVVATDEEGVARSAKAPADDVSVHITAAGFRPVTWIMGNVNELRAIMVRLSPGIVVDEGKPVADAWITNESLQIRADGFTYVPSRDWDGRGMDWSNSDGRFELKTNLTLQRVDAIIPYIAVDASREKMAIQFVPARDSGQPQQLTLHNICHVSGHCLLEGMTESVDVGIGLQSSIGQYIGFLSTRRELRPEGLRVDFQLRLPPGDYVLKSGQSSHHSGFTIPVTVPIGKTELDLGTTTVPATGAVALRGKPAPKLECQWRPGQESTWEELRGKVVVLDFWGTWCGPCVSDMPLLMDIADQFRDKPVKWLSIHTPNLKTFDELDRGIATCQEKSWNKRALPFTTVLDSPVTDKEFSGQTSQSYGVVEWPTFIVVDQQGHVVGPIPKKKLAEAIARLLDSGTNK